ncbi:MAG: hypothetical protein KAI24_12840 [Planctomycetes bacterium]|nr:hypothetical protein [Planctomycetota bacterium]
MRSALVLACALLAPSFAAAQVHYHPDGRPWKQRAGSGPDRVVDGWYYNLGVTGIRVELVENAPTHLVVRHVFDGSPATGKVRVGDHIVGANGARFTEPHRNGYGMKVFGPHGPILAFAEALDAALGGADRRRLDLTIERGSAELEVKLKLSRQHGTYAESFPFDCAKTARLRDDLLDWLLEQQRDDGSFGSPPVNLFAPLAMLSSGQPKYRKAVERAARFHARTTSAKDHGSLINWRYCAAGIFLSEYYLATNKRWVLEELQQVHDFLMHSQYTDPAQINPKARETHPDAVPKQPGKAEGGWGHNPGFEGYGPIAMITGQAALALALMKHCGVDVDQARHEAAYDFLARGTGRNGYVWYGDEVAGHDRYADMGRTGAAGIACWLSPWPGDHRERALRHARCIGEHPDSFPDTHGSPTMGMAFAALAANVDEASFRSLMKQNRWWFTLSRCADDGTFYYQPNRDNAGYGGDSRLKPSAVVALIFSIPERNLVITGKARK